MACGYVAAGAFFFHKKGPHISGSPELVGTLPQAPFFSTQKMGWEGPKWGREGFFPAKKNIADILGRTDFDFENFQILDFLEALNG